MNEGEFANTVVKVKAASGVGLGSMMNFLFVAHWRWTITLILLVLAIVSSMGECFEQKSFYPLVTNVGGKLLSSDEQLYWRLKDIESNNWKLPLSDIQVNEEDGFWKDLKSVFGKVALFFDFLATFWYVYVVVYIFYWLFKVINTSGTIAFNIIFAILIVALLQSAYGAIMLYMNDDCTATTVDKCLPQTEKYSKAFFSLTPLKGTGFMVMNLINGNLITTFSEGAVPLVVNMTNSS